MSDPTPELTRTRVSGPPTDDFSARQTFLAHPHETQTQVGRLAQEMVQAWSRGHRLFAEAFLDRYPELRDNRDAVLRLVCEEIALRDQAGMELSRDDLLRRFPRWTVELQALLDCQDLIGEAESGPSRGVKPLLQEFDILAELGEGAQGQVYLARQRSLANRPLVVKVSTRKGHEHVSLARLQHTNIVPLYWVKDDPENDRRTLVMPYFGKVTLSAVLRAVHNKKVEDRRGSDIVNVLDAARETMTLDQPGQSPVRDYYRRVTYVEAVCWIGSLLADALEYAHCRGLVHLDMKPSNVLLANDGQAMLLDFHLSCPPLLPGQSRPTRMGGTPMYMSPEQHAGMVAVSNGRDIPLVIDGRSDVYSLGAILYQLLGGKIPFVPSPSRLDAITKAVSCGLADIIAKCLAPDATDRYATAGDLAEDLRRHIHHQPLLGVPNRSWQERWRKFRRRKPHGVTMIALVSLLGVVAIWAWLALGNAESARQHDRRTRIMSLQSQAQKQLDAKRAADAVPLLTQAFNLAADSEPDLQGEIGKLLQQAKRSEVLQSLYAVAEEARFAAAAPVSQQWSGVEQGCRKVWERRDHILATAAETANNSEIDSAKLDLLDLALLSAHLRVAAASPALRPAVARDTLATLLEAEKLLGASPILARESERLAKIAGGVAIDPKPTREPQSAWEHYAVGRSYLLEDRLLDADRHFKESLKLDPQAFWSNFCAGLCAHRLEHFPEAVAAFRAALVAKPCAPAYYNRARAYVRMKDDERAFDDYAGALKLDARFSPAWYARGKLYLQREKYLPALADFQEALECGHDPAEGHYHSALAHRGLKDHNAALRSLEQALRHQPDFGEAKALRDKLSSKR